MTGGQLQNRTRGPDLHREQISMASHRPQTQPIWPIIHASRVQRNLESQWQVYRPCCLAVQAQVRLPVHPTLRTRKYLKPQQALAISEVAMDILQSTRGPDHRAGVEAAIIHRQLAEIRTGVRGFAAEPKPTATRRTFNAHGRRRRTVIGSLTNRVIANIE